ncbi:MAG: response regulator, partial [Gluconobacter sp.]
MADTSRHELIAAVPYARRFARALAGDQAQGDQLVASALKDFLAEEKSDLPPRLALYGKLVQAFSERNADRPDMTLVQRALMLLTSLEEQSLASAARALSISEEDAAANLAVARQALQGIAQTTVLIIEDEPIIAMDIQDLVERCGHKIA